MKKLSILLFFIIALVFAASAKPAPSPAMERILDSRSFELKVKMGLVPGYSSINKFGMNLTVETGTLPEDVWEYGGEYVYDATNTAPIAYISSDNLTDTNHTIRIVGLDIDGAEVTQLASVDGQNIVTLDTPLWRVYRMQNMSSASLTGILYCHTDAAPTAGVPDSASQVRAIIDNGNNQTLMSLYTIPAGKVGFFYMGEVGVQLDGNAQALAEYARIQLEARLYGKVFSVKKSVTCIVGGNTSYRGERLFPDPAPALTDIKAHVIDVTADMGLWVTFEILLVDETEFPADYLQSIGQPGY
jgi:hypothetical protein